MQLQFFRSRAWGIEGYTLHSSSEEVEHPCRAGCCCIGGSLHSLSMSTLDFTWCTARRRRTGKQWAFLAAAAAAAAARGGPTDTTHPLDVQTNLRTRSLVYSAAGLGPFSSARNNKLNKSNRRLILVPSNEILSDPPVPAIAVQWRS